MMNLDTETITPTSMEIEAMALSLASKALDGHRNKAGYGALFAYPISSDIEAVALRLAATAFDGRKDKAGQPYILHLLRVGMKQKTPRRRALAFLHDYMEDIPAFIVAELETVSPELVTHKVTKEERWQHEQTIRDNFIEQFRTEFRFDDKFMHSLDCLTHRRGESYEDYVERAASDEDAAAVKDADLDDNMDLSRVNWLITEYDYAQYAKYARGKMRIREVNIERLAVTMRELGATLTGEPLDSEEDPNA